MSENVLIAENLIKSFGSLVAVNGLSLTIQKGSIYGLLGPNGSGKSTTLGMLLGVLEPDSGTYSWFGRGPDPTIRRKIGTLLEGPNFYGHLSGYQNLKINATIKEVPYTDIHRVLEIVNLSGKMHAKFRAYSTGMKMRLGIANALLGDPALLVLDEPTNGLDPQGIAEIRELMLRLRDQGKTILLASHLLDEVEKVCSHVAVIQRGKKLFEGTVASFLAGADGKQRIEVSSNDNSRLTQLLGGFPGIEKITPAAEYLLLSAQPQVRAEEINRYLFENGVVLNHLAIEKTTLEEQFLELTGRK